MNNKSNVSIIDSDFIPFYTCHNKKGDKEKSLDDCIWLCDNFIENINKATKADYYIGYITKGKCFRYNINSEYKANRKNAIFPKYSLEVREHLISKHNFISIEGFEADDLVVSFSKQYSDKYDCIIVSPDKDIINLEGIHFNPKKMEYVSITKQEAEEYFWKSMIIGDPGDNIKGLVGKGESFFKNRFSNSIVTGGGILDEYIHNLKEFEGIEEFYKNYRCLRIIDNVNLGEIRLNEVIKIPSE